MPSGSYMQAYVQCPFYKFDDGRRRITCEGLIEDSSMSLIYHNKADYDRQIGSYCCRSYDKCEIFALLQNKYEEDE